MGILFGLDREAVENIHREKLKSNFPCEDWKEVSQRNERWNWK